MPNHLGNRIKRAVLEWSMITAATPAGGCLLLWVATTCTARANFSLLFDRDRGLAVADGALVVSNRLNSMLTMEETEKTYPGSFPGIGPGLRLPGFRNRHFIINSNSYSLTSLSLLFPALVFALAALVLFRQYRRIVVAGEE